MNDFLHCLKLIFLTLIFTFTSCGLYICDYKIGKNEYYQFVEIQSDNLDELYQQFSYYSVEQQIDIYLYAQRCPDNPQIQKFLMNNGENKVPAIVERISKESVENKYHLMRVLIAINWECNCIKKDSEVIKRLESVQPQMSSDNDNIRYNTYTKGYRDFVNILKEQMNK